MTDQEKEKILARAQADRRRYRRVHVGLAGRLFVPADGSEARCTVIDMSPGGARISCETIPEEGTSIVLYVDTFGRFEGQIVRPEGDAFGVRFNCSAMKRERIAEQLTLYLNKALADDSVLRRHDRTQTKGMARYTRANGDIVQCEVVDLSLSGVSLKTENRPPIGEFVLIGQMAGRIARHHEDGIAIEFLNVTPAPSETERPPRKLSAVR